MKDTEELKQQLGVAIAEHLRLKALWQHAIHLRLGDPALKALPTAGDVRRARARVLDLMYRIDPTPANLFAQPPVEWLR